MLTVLRQLLRLRQLFRIHQLLRGMYIVLLVLRFLVRPEMFMQHPVIRALCYLNPFSWQRPTSRGQLIRHLLEKLGPIFIKFGQQLSTRRDLIPAEIADQLAYLQDQVPAFSAKRARAIIEAELRQPIAQLFAEFNDTPLASASIAQVHAAKLNDGQQVVIKVVRPRIKRRILRDVSLMQLGARLATHTLKIGPRLRLIELVAEFKYTILNELDMQREAANAATLRRHFEHSSLLYIPQVYWPYVTLHTLVLERIHGIPISQVEDMRKKGFDLKQLAEHGVEIFFTQVFRDSFFHADMHPGNIFVNPEDPTKNQYMGVDFGIMGSLTPEDQYYLAENLLAFFNRDYRRVAQLHIDSGWVAADTRLEHFESAIRTVCEPIFERPLEDVSFAKVLLRLFQTAKDFKMTVQPQLMLLQKTLFNIEGLGRQLYPQLNLWDSAKPFLEKFVRQQRGPCATTKQILKRIPDSLDALSELPALGRTLLQHANLQQLVAKQKMQINQGKKASKNASNASNIAMGLFYAAVVTVVFKFSLPFWYKSPLSRAHKPPAWQYKIYQHANDGWQYTAHSITQTIQQHGLLIACLLLIIAFAWPRKS